MPTNAQAAGAITAKMPVVAIVEDDETFRKYLSVLFEVRNYRVEQAACSRELFDILATRRVDCIILDYNLDSENGLAVHARIKESVTDAPPIVMLTGDRDERTIIRAFRGGISDYVLKRELQPEEIFRAVTGAIERHDRARVSDRRTPEFDEATGLHSRAAIDQQLARIAPGRHAKRSAIMLIAIDNLHDLGEQFGPAAVDRAVRSFVTRLKRVLGPNDIGGRYDDVRFIAITDIDARFKTIHFACERLAREVAFGVDVGAAAFKVTTSIGAAAHPLEGNTTQAALAAAEQALKKASARGIPYAIAEGFEDLGRQSISRRSEPGSP
jgi:diguanylate cyclase (GGDEF)-like protein